MSHIEIRRELRRRIESGEFAEGEQVPSELDLMRTMNATRAQAREALLELEREGYVLRYQGKGSFVAPVEHRLKHLGIKGFRLAAMSCNRLSSHYKREVIDGFSSELHEHGIQLLTYFLDLTSGAERQFLQGIRGSGLEGLALWIRDRSDETRDILEMFRETHFPFVLCDRTLPGFEADSVVSNNEEIGYELTLGLLARGYSRIAFIGAQTRMTSTEDRELGYRRALSEMGLSVDEGHVCWPDGTEESVAAKVKAVMAHRLRPTALFCCDDRVAATAIGVLTELGYALPRDMAFAAVDDDRSLRNYGLPILSLEQDGARIGRETARLLVARILDPRRAVENVVVETHVEHDLGSEGGIFGQAGVPAGTGYSVKS